jgi:hypothetical protein
VTIGAANQIGLAVFDGVAGARASIQLANGTFFACDVSHSGTNISVLNPQGVQVGGASCLGGSGTVDTFSLDQTGTYTVIVAPQTGGTGSVDLTVSSVPSDFVSTIVPGGAGVTVATSAPGQNAYLTFSGTQNQIVSVVLSAYTYPICSVSSGGVNITIYSPDGSVLVSSPCTGGFIDSVTLPASGTYKIFIDPTSSYVGSTTVTLYNIVDVTKPIVIGGTQVTVATTVPGQNAYLTFSATQGQKVALQLSMDHYPGCTIQQAGVNVAFRNPDNSVIANFQCIGQQTLPTVTLSQPGTQTYTIFFDPQSTYIGDVVLTLLSM